MRLHRRSRLALVSAVAGVACLALATPASAAVNVALQQSNVPALTPGGDPAGANGTVKIDGLAFDNGIDNEPHVTCEFRVNFFNFDKQEYANIVFTVHEPTGSGTELLRRNHVLVSQDAAGGGKPDPDESFTFSTSELGLDAYTPHPKQGYHIKLTVERIGAPGAGKHKVFWVQACQDGTSSPSSPPPGGGNGGAGGNGGGLPVTGMAVGGTVLLGGALLAGGATLLVIYRRRKTIFTN
jgi:LPXTG-motif cell wall-anchored protein